MADTIRTIPELLALFADNSSGNISPQDLRDAIVSFDARVPVVSVSHSMQSGAAGTYYVAGMYEAPVADSNLTQASASQTLGLVNIAHAMHAFVVAGGAGVTDGTNLVLTVTGISITDAGVRTVGDSEVIVADCRTAGVNTYFETNKKWLGQVTYTLSSDGAAWSYDFNYGYCKYSDFGNRDFDIDSFEIDIFAAANDAGFEIEVLHHKSTGWTYHATAFVPGNGALNKLSDDYSTDSQLKSGDWQFYKRSGLSHSIAGASSEGFLIRITTATNNSVSILNSNIFLLPTG